MGVPATIPLDFSAVYASIFTFYILLCVCVFVFHVFCAITVPTDCPRTPPAKQKNEKKYGPFRMIFYMQKIWNLTQILFGLVFKTSGSIPNADTSENIMDQWIRHERVKVELLPFFF